MGLYIGLCKLLIQLAQEKKLLYIKKKKKEHSLSSIKERERERGRERKIVDAKYKGA